MEKLRIIVGGYIGLFPTGGATWDYIQYPLGFALLGHDVYYIEDTMSYPVFQASGDKWNDCSFGVAYLAQAMTEVGLQNRWAYRDIASGKIFGLTENEIKEVCKTADVFINVSSSTFLREEYLQIPIKIFIDTDPMFTQYQYFAKQEEGGETAAVAARYMKAHDLFFTYGLHIGQPGCRIPQYDFKWLTTKSPVCLEFWEQPVAVKRLYGFTSIMNWKERPDFTFLDETWGQKNKEFQKFVGLPAVCRQDFEIVINRTKDAATVMEMDRLAANGWKILNPEHLIPDKEFYKSFVQSSYAEFSITKETYIKANTGWFSGRSAVYLASGKPVLTQDTAWSNYIPAGEGLIAIADVTSAEEAVRSVNSDYKRHARAAREIAHQFFDSKRVLNEMLSHV